MKKKHEVFVWVDPKCSLSGSSSPGDTPLPPKKIDLAKFGFELGDYVGLAKTGRYIFNSPKKDTADNLMLKYSNDPPRYMKTDQEIFRLVEGTIVYFAPGDAYFKDNKDPEKDFGVVISYINSPPTIKSNDSTESDDFVELQAGDVGDMYIAADEEDMPDVGDAQFPSLFSVINNNFPEMQYRGWAEYNSWSPQGSHWHGRPGGKHCGIDVFMPYGTDVVCPVDGFFEPRYGSNDFGSWGLITFKQNKKKKYLCLCHLSQIYIKTAGRIKAGTAIGTSGCSGNAANSLPCGSASKRNSYGGRSDHVHVEVRLGSAADGSVTEDPAVTFGWSVKLKY